MSIFARRSGERRARISMTRVRDVPVYNDVIVRPHIYRTQSKTAFAWNANDDYYAIGQESKQRWTVRMPNKMELIFLSRRVMRIGYRFQFSFSHRVYFVKKHSSRTLIMFHFYSERRETFVKGRNNKGRTTSQQQRDRELIFKQTTETDLIRCASHYMNVIPR